MAWKPDYCTVAELKAFIQTADTADDAQLALAITAASRAIDYATGRQFGQVESVEDRLYAPWWNKRKGCWEVEIDDLQDLTGLVIAYDELNDWTYSYDVTTDYRLLPLNAAEVGLPYTSMAFRRGGLVRQYEVRITALWGWETVPQAVKEATLLQAARLHQRRWAPFGVTGSPESDSETRLLAKLDPDVEVAIRPLRRWWGAK